MDQAIMDDAGSGNKPAPVASGSPDKQGNSAEHQQDRQQREAGKSTDVTGQSAVGHAVNGAAAEGGHPPKKTEGGQGVPHDTLRAGFPYLTVFNAVLAFTAVVGMFFTGLQLKVAQGQLEQASIANERVNDALRVANRQADAAEAANKIASEALTASDRAWLSFRPLVGLPPSADQDFEAGAAVTNIGKTPANNTSVSLTMYVTYPEDQTSTLMLKNDYSNTIFPDASLKYQAKIFKEDLPPSVVDDIKNGKKFINLIAYVQYEDVLKKKHETRSCFQWSNKIYDFTSCAKLNSDFAD